VEVEKELGFTNKRDIEEFGLAEFVRLCKARVLKYAAIQTEQSIRLGYWMDWNNTDDLRRLSATMLEDAEQEITVEGVDGPVTGSAEQIVAQLGLPDLGGSYFTFSDENNYQIWGFLKQCDDNGWLFKGRDVMPWCARCGTGITQHEIVTDGYHDVAHDSVFLRFPLTARSTESGELVDVSGQKEALLVWTTTPWTLTSNVAAAVGPALDYVKVQAADGWTYYLAEGAMENTLIGKENEVVGKLKGSDLVGWQYSGPFDELPVVQESFTENDYTHRVIPWKDVGAEEGTGIVHIAPGCGAEDFQLSKEHDLPIVAPLNEDGIYLDGFDWLSSRSVHDVAPDIFTSLREKDIYYRKQRYEHRYPHCWRCGSELVYRLVDEWFINMGDTYDKPREELTDAEKQASLRYQIMDRVDQANWYPSFGYDREMDWLRNMDNWMISKKRYYGLALPIWTCDDCGYYTVIGDEDELQERAVEGWDEFAGHTPHRPYIDAIKIACPHCGNKASRIAAVGDPWLDAGIVGLSTLQYRSNKQFWEKWYPADWISESFPGQFRNWFYSLLAQSTVMAEEPPFLNLFGYATLLAEDGREMHKSWGNSIEFNEAAAKMGADTMRWLYANARPEQNLLFGYTRGDETRRRFLIPLWNVYAFFVSYARLDGWLPGEQAVVSPNPAHAQMDRWIVERLKETALVVRAALDKYDAERATKELEAFLDDLSNWYVRRSRRRFWKSEADDDKSAAYATLYQVLVDFARLLAPFIPFTTEVIYQNLVSGLIEDAPSSVHHTMYPGAGVQELDKRLLAKMRLAITTASLGRAARGSADIKLRQPLAAARINVGSQQERVDLLELAEVLKQEINVKDIEVVSEVGELVNYKLLPNNRVLGPRLGRMFPKVKVALEKIDPAEAARSLQAGQTIHIEVDGQEFELDVDDVLVQTESRGGLAVASDKGITVAVDTRLTPELLREGYARDLVRAINNMRKEAGFDISDRIVVVYEADGEVEAALRDFAGYIQQETLAVTLQQGTMDNATFDGQVNVGGQDVRIAFRIAG
jgi:isoleucyl-tRNA synthetase